jgi:hypothetical protein
VFFAAQILPGIALITYGAVFYIRQKRIERAKAKAEAAWNRDLAAFLLMFLDCFDRGAR